MSSAANEKRGHLEDEFQRRMHDAEASPSPDLWARIDHDLTIQESKHYRDRMVWYRQLAAACFVLFMLAGALLTYTYKTEQSIDAGIAAMQIPAEASGTAERMATDGEPETEPSVQEPGLPAGKASAAGGYAGTEPMQQNNKAAGRRAGTAIAKQQRLVAAKSFLASEGRGTTQGAAAYNPNAGAAVAAEPSAIAEGQRIFSKAQDEFGGGRAVASRFDVGRPFFQTARQAITSVPSSYLSAAEQSSAGRTRSLVELSHTSSGEQVTMQKKAEELAVALNPPVSGSEKEEKEAAKDSRWSLGLAYAPSYFNQNIEMPNQMMSAIDQRTFFAGGADKTSLSSYNMNRARDEFEANTDPAFSYGAELKAGLKLFKKLKLLAGVGFTQNAAKTKSSYIVNQYLYKPGTNERVPMPTTTVFLPALNNNFTTDSLSVAKTDEFYVNYRYRHVTLPVGLQYEGNVGKSWFWYAAGGMAANFLVESTVMSSSNDVKDVSYGHSDDSPFRKLQFSGNISTGFGKRISNTVSVTAGPEFRGYLSSLLAEPDKALAPQGNPYTIGINMSVNYNLGQK